MLPLLLLLGPPVGPVPADPFDRPGDITVVAVVHPFTAAVWMPTGELLTISPEKDEPGTGGQLRRYGRDLTLMSTVKLPATASALVLDEAIGRLFAITGTATDDSPSAGMLVAYKLDDLTGESARPTTTLRAPFRVRGVARSVDGKVLYVAVSTAVLTVDPTTLRQMASNRGVAERVTPTGRPLVGKVRDAIGEFSLVGDPPRLLRGDIDLTPPTGLGAVGHLAATGDRVVLTTATSGGIELLTIAGGRAVSVAKRADKPPYQFYGPVAITSDGRRAACGSGLVVGLPAPNSPP